MYVVHENLSPIFQTIFLVCESLDDFVGYLALHRLNRACTAWLCVQAVNACIGVSGV